MPTTFLTLPRELRQKILLEAIIPKLQTAINTYSLFRILNYPQPYSCSGTIAASSMAAACTVIATVAATPQISEDLVWIEEMCVEVLEGYREAYRTAAKGHFRGLSRWIVARDQTGAFVFQNFSH